MSFVSFVIVASAVSIVFLVTPIVAALRAGASSALPGFGVLVIHFSPVILAVIYFQYSESHPRIPVFSYERPPIAGLYACLAVLQALATGLALFRQRLKALAVVACAAMSVVDCLGVAFLAQGVVACAHGNCF